MPEQTRIVSPGPLPRTVLTAGGEVLHPPADWVLVPPGDAALTRRVKAAGPTWTVQQRRGRKVFSRGIWAAASVVARIEADLKAERATPQHARRREADAERRKKVQGEYETAFHRAVLDFLDFHVRHADRAESLARAVVEHAVPVGSGTVARTTRIPIERRAEAAVIAWMRHRTTGYDSMAIPRVKGERREVRRLLAARSRELLQRYRRGEDIDVECPLLRALNGAATDGGDGDSDLD